MATDISNQVVAVTGASSGIGEAIAVACAREGAAVALAARRIERIEGLAERTPLLAEDIANAVLYAISQPPNVAVGELLIRPAGQG
jgi:NADP-dependent 3-hydroxy acid dehydrogenase YdfG